MLLRPGGTGIRKIVLQQNNASDWNIPGKVSTWNTKKNVIQESHRCVNATLLCPPEKEKAYNTLSTDTMKKHLSKSQWQGTSGSKMISCSVI